MTRITFSRETGAVTVHDSCGCVFCDLGDRPREYDGVLGHLQKTHDVVPCTRRDKIYESPHK